MNNQNEIKKQTQRHDRGDKDRKTEEPKAKTQKPKKDADTKCMEKDAKHKDTQGPTLRATKPT